jgi:nitrate reductase molybdenum cofactor assembly chaperone NarJ/NarW
MLEKNILAPMGKTLRVLSALLRYPDVELRQQLTEMRDLLHREETLRTARLAELETLIDALSQRDSFDVESDYVELFDRGRATSLHLFEHVHGDSRDRGPAMIDLAQTYANAGLHLVPHELPDYLPVVLEFAASQPPHVAKEFLGEIAHILNAIYVAIARRDSNYASVIGALLDLAGEVVQPVKPLSDVPLDESWAEPAAFDGCPSQSRPGATATHSIKIYPPINRRASNTNCVSGAEL